MNKITADGVAATEGTEAGEFEMPQIWHRPLMISDFEGVPAGYTVTLHYNSSNEGSMDWTHRAIVDGERGKRLLGSADGAPEMPCLYNSASHVASRTYAGDLGQSLVGISVAHQSSLQTLTKRKRKACILFDTWETKQSKVGPQRTPFRMTRCRTFEIAL
eukprot:m.464432 g.464432  ORF g.464432 m.464432 type:complete len:160 (-) comp23504_c0_seq1:2501-2980(-)